MIANFKDDATRDIYDGANTKAARSIPMQVWSVAQRKLDSLNAAQDLKDLASPPGNRLESLKGKWAGEYSIRVNDQYRIVFGFSAGRATDVRITDYH